MPSPSRTSIIPHVGRIVQNIVSDRYRKISDAHKKRTVAFEKDMLKILTNQPAEKLVKLEAEAAKCIHRTAFKIQFAPPDVDKDRENEIRELIKQINGTLYTNRWFYLSPGFDTTTLNKAGEFIVNSPTWAGGSSSQKPGPLKMAPDNSYVMCGPPGYTSWSLQPESRFSKSKQYDKSTVFISDTAWAAAADLEIELLRHYVQSVEVSNELVEAFRQRKTVERFIEDFPELKKFVPFIPSPVRALVTPASRVLETIESVPVE